MDRATDFELPAHDGSRWRLSTALGSGPVLLVFYRGDW
jgi:peroxiredoxin